MRELLYLVPFRLRKLKQQLTMPKIFFPLLILFITVNAFSQKASQYDNILLSTPNDFRKAEPQVMLAADYVYSIPVEKDNINRNNAITFISKWMRGTPDFSFVMDETLTKITINDRDLIGVYFVCLVKYGLEKGKGVDRDELKLNSYILFANYCENPANNCKPKGEILKMIEAKKNNKLKEYLDSKLK
jgi:hypothetical protein